MTPSRANLNLRVPERGTLSLNRSGFHDLAESERVARLVHDGILALVRSKEVPYGVRGSCFVGHAVLENGTRLEVREKTPGALNTLLYWSVPSDLRETAVPSQIGPVSQIVDTFARRFLKSLADYVRHGRVKAYLPQTQRSSTVRGKICVKETMRLLGRGQRGQVVQRITVLSADVLVNQLLHLGLLAVEQLFAANEYAKRSLAEARMYAPLFADADIRDLRLRGYTFAASAFDRALKHAKTSEELRTALAYARALGLHLGIWPTDESAVAIPDSFFLNLETLFEAAVRQYAQKSSQRSM